MNESDTEMSGATARDRPPFPEIDKVHVYVRDGTFLIQDEGGGSGEVVTLSTTASDTDLGLAVMNAFPSGREPPESRREDGKTPRERMYALVRAAGVRSVRQFHRDATLLVVVQEESWIVAMPSSYVDGGFDFSWDAALQADDLSPITVGCLVREGMEYSHNTTLPDREMRAAIDYLPVRYRTLLIENHLLANYLVGRRSERGAVADVIDYLMWNPAERSRIARFLSQDKIPPDRQQTRPSRFSGAPPPDPPDGTSVQKPRWFDTLPTVSVFQRKDRLFIEDDMSGSLGISALALDVPNSQLGEEVLEALGAVRDEERLAALADMTDRQRWVPFMKAAGVRTLRELFEGLKCVKVVRAGGVLLAESSDYFDETFYGCERDEIVQTDDLSSSSVGDVIRVALNASNNTVLSDDELSRLLSEASRKGRGLLRDHLVRRGFVSRDRTERVAWSIVIDQLTMNPEVRGRLARILHEAETARKQPRTSR